MQNPNVVRSQVEKLIGDDPTLIDATKIITRVDRVGPVFKKQLQLTLEGKVANARERDKINQILKSHFRDSLTIDDKLTIG